MSQFLGQPSNPPTNERLFCLEGRARARLAYNLPHEIFCATRGHCGCRLLKITTNSYSKADQQSHPKTELKRINPSLTIGRGERAFVPLAVLSCPEIKSALARGDLRLRNE